MANKVKFGLKNLYYAVATIATDGSATYGTPVKIPGAVSIALEPTGEAQSFYADDIEYFKVPGAAGYSGDVEVALIPDSFASDCLGEDTSETGALIELADASPKPFALLFEFSTDDKAQKFVMYNCSASRTTIEGQTKADTTEVKTEKFTLSASAIYNAVKDANIIKAKAGSTHPSYSSWYTSVWQPVTQPEPPEEDET